jgi:hypothetical protein
MWKVAISDTSPFDGSASVRVCTLRRTPSWRVRGGVNWNHQLLKSLVHSLFANSVGKQFQSPVRTWSGSDATKDRAKGTFQESRNISTGHSKSSSGCARSYVTLCATQPEGLRADSETASCGITSRTFKPE